MQTTDPFSSAVLPSVSITDTAKRSLSWVLAASLLGFLISSLFSSVLALPRPWLVAAYLLIAGPFLLAYAHANQVNVGAQLRSRKYWGLGGAIVLGTFMV